MEYQKNQTEKKLLKLIYLKQKKVTKYPNWLNKKNY